MRIILELFREAHREREREREEREREGREGELQ